MDIAAIVRIAESVVIIVTVAAGVFDMFRKEKRNIREWLLLAVTEAERAFGGGTGAVKLRYVWEKAREVFPVLTKFIGFDAFSEMVEDRLADLEHILGTNTSLAEYISEGRNDETGGDSE